MESFDVAIIGLGALGSASAYQAAIKGAKVIGFEQYEFGHVRGASHDTSRIVRTCERAPEYVALAKSAFKDWADLEQRTGQKLLTITGGVVFLPRDGPNAASDYTNCLDTFGILYELLDAKEVNKRWPQFNIDDRVDTIYTADTGIVHASKSVAAMQYLARSHGAVLNERTRVDRIIPDSSGSGVTVHTSNGQYHTSKVIITADAWANHLLAPLKAEIPLTIMQEQVTYFKPTDAALFESDKFPVWIWGEEKWFYGFPCYGEPTIKAARDVSNNVMDPTQRTYVHSTPLLEELNSFMCGFVPDKGQPLRTITCQYALTPERRFVLSPLKNHRNIFVGLCAGHGFKYAPAVGRVLAELALDGKTSDDVSTFGIPAADPVGSSKL